MYNNPKTYQYKTIQNKHQIIPNNIPIIIYQKHIQIQNTKSTKPKKKIQKCKKKYKNRKYKIQKT